MHKQFVAIFVAIMFLMNIPVHAEEKINYWPKPDTPAVKTWQALEYGMFIHYGLSTFTGNAHQKTKVDPATYAPTALDVAQWVRIAHEAGMKYIVLTSKHTAGHCLWDSKVEWNGKEFDYDIAQGADTTDVIGAFVDACAKYDILPGLYYCLEDYVNNANYREGGPMRNARNMPEAYHQLVKAHLTELLTQYPTVNYLWLDIPVQASVAQRTEIYQMIKRIRPDCLVLYNWGVPASDGHLAKTAANTWPTDIANTELRLLDADQFQARQEFQGKVYTVGYEHCDKIGKYWFWKPDEKPRAASDLFKLYKDVVKLGGNLLLNVPPDTSGRIPETHVNTLMQIKKMIDKGEPAAFTGN